jgi:hypothetical protein
MFGRTSILRFRRDASKAGESKNAGRSETINDDHDAEIPMRSFAYFCGSAAAFLMAACGRRVGNGANQ